MGHTPRFVGFFGQAYNARNELTTVTYPDSSTSTRRYHSTGALNELALDGSTISTRSYDAGRRQTTEVLGNGITETRSYRSDNLLSGISYSNTSLGDLSYTRDANKNKTSESITGVMSGYGFTSGGTTYDFEDRLTGYARASGTFNQSWNLTSVGDWTSVTTNGIAQNRTHGPTHELLTAGLQNDVFNPRKPTVISLAAMFTTGNTGSFRSQARIERFIKPSDASEYTFQLALSDPIQSVFGSRDLRIQEDNGWPNVEGRVSMGLGQAETLTGGRKARPFELGSSAFVGQIRTTRSILAPQDPQSPVRNVVDCWGFGVDAAVNLTELIGIQGELFTGAGLGEYNGGIGQTFDSATREAIRSSGGWCEVFAYLTPKLHVHSGYGIDSPLRRAGDTFALTQNQTFFTNVVWNWSKNVQISNQVDYRMTDYRAPLLDATGAIFYSEFLWRF